MSDDPIVSEIGKIREEYAASLRNDLEQIVADLRSLQGKDGRRVVDLSSPQSTDPNGQRERSIATKP